jgi:hypothetical protein
MVESRAIFEVGEHVDCLDTFQKWCDAKVTEITPDSVRITFTGYTSKYDEVIPIDSKRI